MRRSYTPESLARVSEPSSCDCVAKNTLVALTHRLMADGLSQVALACTCRTGDQHGCVLGDEAACHQIVDHRAIQIWQCVEVELFDGLGRVERRAP